jgi:hypothetical protein
MYKKDEHAKNKSTSHETVPYDTISSSDDFQDNQNSDSI